VGVALVIGCCFSEGRGMSMRSGCVVDLLGGKFHVSVDFLFVSVFERRVNRTMSMTLRGYFCCCSVILVVFLGKNCKALGFLLRELVLFYWLTRIRRSRTLGYCAVRQQSIDACRSSDVFLISFEEAL